MSEYVVSARKYRPDSFESLVGQDNIAQTLKNSILRGQLAHAYLFCGPRGVGKTSAARIFAKTINCSNPGEDMEPCGECESCRSFAEGRSYCIHELDAASNNGVDDIKALMDKVQIPPQVGRYSVYIIDEVHMLSQAAFNAFLKTLEEPPAHAIFILATTEKHKIIPTILSRCQTYDFNRISVPDIVGNLRGIATKENISIDDESLHVIAHKADGAMRDALTIFDQTVAFCGTDIHYDDVIRNLNVLDYEYSFKLLDAFLNKDHGTALLTFDEILNKGFNALHFISALGSHLRDLLVSRTGGLESLLDLPDSLRARYREQASKCSLKFLFDGLNIISQCEAGYRASTNQRLHIEFALMKLSFLSGMPASQAAPAATFDGGSAPVTPPGSLRSLPASEHSAGQGGLEAAAVKAPAPEAKPEEPAAVIPAECATLGTIRGGTMSEANGGVGGADVGRKELPEAKEVEAPAPKPKPRARTPKTGFSLSLGALMNDDEEPMIELAADVAAEPQAAPALPSDEAVAEQWKVMAAQQSQPRLANALAASKLEFREEDGVKNVDFYVTNAAQKKWIEERCLRQLEGTIQQLTGCNRIRLNPVVTPEEQQEKKIYMPQEQAQDLMSRNENVKAFVAEFGLDI